jgi:hypothetical protein
MGMDIVCMSEEEMEQDELWMSVERATWIIRDRRDSEPEYCNMPWYSSRAVILLTIGTRWA